MRVRVYLHAFVCVNVSVCVCVCVCVRACVYKSTFICARVCPNFCPHKSVCLLVRLSICLRIACQCVCRYLRYLHVSGLYIEMNHGTFGWRYSAICGDSKERVVVMENPN